MALKDEIQVQAGVPTPTPFQAVIATTAVATSDLVYVTIPAFDPALRFGPCYWGPEREGQLPTRGMPCLVMFDNFRRPWIINWWPY